MDFKNNEPFSFVSLLNLQGNKFVFSIFITSYLRDFISLRPKILLQIKVRNI